MGLDYNVNASSQLMRSNTEPKKYKVNHRVRTYFFLSNSGKSVLEYFSITTCKKPHTNKNQNTAQGLLSLKSHHTIKVKIMCSIPTLITNHDAQYKAPISIIE